MRNFEFMFEKSKHLNSVMSVFFNSLASVLAESPTRNLQKITESHVCIPSILSFIWRDLAIAFKSLNGRETVCINQWNLMNEKKQPLKVFWKKRMCSIKKVFLQISQNSQQKSVPD